MFVSALPDPTCNSEKSANGGNKQILLLLLLLLIRSHRGVWVSRQNSRLLLKLAAPIRAHSTRKVLFNEFFSLKMWKTFRKWSGIVSFVSLSIKKTVESRRNNSGKGKTERDVSSCVFCWSYFAFHFSLSLNWNRLKFTHFQLWIENKQLRLHIVLGIPHILTVIYVFNKRFY